MKKTALILGIILILTGCFMEEKTNSQLYQVTVSPQQNNESYYREVITMLSFGGQAFATGKRRTIELPAGNYDIVWGYANINGYGSYLNEKTKYESVEIYKDTLVIVKGGTLIIE